MRRIFIHISTHLFASSKACLSLSTTVFIPGESISLRDSPQVTTRYLPFYWKPKPYRVYCKVGDRSSFESFWQLWQEFKFIQILVHLSVSSKVCLSLWTMVVSLRQHFLSLISRDNDEVAFFVLEATKDTVYWKIAYFCPCVERLLCHCRRRYVYLGYYFCSLDRLQLTSKYLSLMTNSLGRIIYNAGRIWKELNMLLLI